MSNESEKIDHAFNRAYDAAYKHAMQSDEVKNLVKAANYALLELQIIPCKCDQKAIDLLDGALKPFNPHQK